MSKFRERTLLGATMGPNKLQTTHTPTTSDIIIPAGTYLAGKQTITGDADLVAGNIKSGVVLFGVTGTLAAAPTAMEGWTQVTGLLYKNKIGKLYLLGGVDSGYYYAVYDYSTTANQAASAIGITRAATVNATNYPYSYQYMIYYDGSVWKKNSGPIQNSIILGIIST